MQTLADFGKSKSLRTLLRVLILCFIAGAAVSSRLFSVIRTSCLVLSCLVHAVCIHACVYLC